MSLSWFSRVTSYNPSFDEARRFGTGGSTTEAGFYFLSVSEQGYVLYTLSAVLLTFAKLAHLRALDRYVLLIRKMCTPLY
jgi:hypothetical protein